MKPQKKRKKEKQWLSAYLVQFVSKSSNTWPKFLHTIDDHSSYGGCSECLMVDDIDFLRKHVQEEASTQHVGSYWERRGNTK